MSGLADDRHDWLRAHGPALVLCARQWVGCYADAEDVFQDAFVRFWRRRDGVRDPLAYLYRCVRTAAMNHGRTRQRARRREQEVARGETMFVDQAGAMAATERCGAIQRALAALPVEQREVVVMKVWGGLTFDAIGETIEIPKPTAYARYRAAMSALRRALGREVLE